MSSITCFETPFENSIFISAFAPCKFVFGQGVPNLVANVLLMRAGLSPGTFRVLVSGDQRAAFQNGDSVVLNAGPYTNFVTTVVGTSFVPGPKLTDVFVSGVFLGSGTGTLRKNLPALLARAMFIKILDKNGQSLFTKRLVISKQNRAFIDIRKILSSLFSGSEPAYNTQVERIEKGTFAFKIRFGIDTTDSQDLEPFPGVTVFQAVNAARQIGEKTDMTNRLGGGGKMFLTRFAKPVAFVGFPFSVAFLQDGNVNNVNINANLVSVNAEQGMYMVTPDTTQPGNINIWLES
jgi:hypothetical protein